MKYEISTIYTHTQFTGHFIPFVSLTFFYAMTWLLTNETHFLYKTCIFGGLPLNATRLVPQRLQRNKYLSRKLTHNRTLKIHPHSKN